MQKENIEIQIKYQKELEKLEKENKELRKTLMLKNSQKKNMRKVKVIKNYLISFLFHL